MELSRRGLLRSARLRRSPVQPRDVFGSLAERPSWPSGGTTLARTLVRGAPNAKGYRKIVNGPAEPHQVRTDLGIAAAPGRASCRTPLLAFCQLSDVHVVDHQSPARVEWLDRFEDPNAANVVPGLLSSAYRPQEMLSAQVMDAMVRAINSLPGGPVTGLPLRSRSRPATTPTTASTTRSAGTSTSSTARVVARQRQPQPVRRRDGREPRYYDTHYWHPGGTPLGKKADIYRDQHGFPVITNVLNAARRQFTAAGLDIPWYTCFGNHDGLIAGQFPGEDDPARRDRDRQPEGASTPAGLSQSDVINAVNDQNLDGILNNLLLSPLARIVAKDNNRRVLSRAQVIAEHFNTPAAPAGRARLHRAEPCGGHGVLLLRPRRLPLRGDGLGEPQRVRRRLPGPGPVHLAEGDRRVRHQQGSAGVQPPHADTMGNPLVLTGRDPSPRVLGPAVTSYLLSQQRVIAWVNGHTHRNQVTAHKRTDGTGGFWEINTASHIDFPQQARLIEVTDNGDNTMSIFTTIIDHAGPADWNATLPNTLSLAALAGSCRERPARLRAQRTA